MGAIKNEKFQMSIYKEYYNNNFISLHDIFSETKYLKILTII